MLSIISSGSGGCCSSTVPIREPPLAVRLISIFRSDGIENVTCIRILCSYRASSFALSLVSVGDIPTRRSAQFATRTAMPLCNVEAKHRSAVCFIR
jgi:hypothetical protein